MADPLEPDRTGKRTPRFPVATVLLAAAAVGAWLVPGLAERLEFTRPSIVDGELWRLLTGHLTHLSLEHLAWDLGVFIVLGALTERANRARFLACLGAAAATISVAVWWFAPGLAVYRGLSGLDSALFALLVVTVLHEKLAERRWWSVGAVAAISAAFAAKLVLEATTSTAVFVSTPGLAPVPLAHAIGALVGGVLGWSGTHRRPGAREGARPKCRETMTT